MGMDKFRPPELKNPRTDLDETWNILLRRGITTHATPCGGATVRQRGWSRRTRDLSHVAVSDAAFHSCREVVNTRSRDPGNHEFTTSMERSINT